MIHTDELVELVGPELATAMRVLGELNNELGCLHYAERLAYDRGDVPGLDQVRESIRALLPRQRAASDEVKRLRRGTVTGG